MRFTVAGLMIGLGYALIYWAIERIVIFGPNNGLASGTAGTNDAGGIAPKGSIDRAGMAAVPLVQLLGIHSNGAGALTPPVHLSVNTKGQPVQAGNAAVAPPSGGVRQV